MKIADAFVAFKGDSKDIDKTLDAIPGQAEKPAARAGDVFKKAIAIGTGAVGAGMFAGAIESAAGLEKQMATVNTVAHLNHDTLAGLTTDVQNLSKETGKPTDELTSGLYDLVSAGVPADHAINVLRDSAKLATGALSTTGESVDLVTSALNAWKLPVEESSVVADVFAKVVADGKVTAAELAGSIAQVAPIAASAGISLEEVAAGYAVMTAQGVPAAEASTKMRAAISALLTPNEQLNRLQEQTGKNFLAIAKEKGLRVALEELRVEAAKNGDVFAKLAGVSSKEFPAALKKMQAQLGLSNTDLQKFSDMAGKDGAAKTMQELVKQVGSGDSAFAKSLGSVEAYQFALASTGENAGKFEAEFKAMNNAAGTVDSQVKELSGTSAAAGARIAAGINVGMQKIGELGQPVAPLLLALNAVGPAGLEAGKLAASGLGAAAVAIVGTIGPLIAQAAAWTATAIAENLALWPVLLIVAAVALLAAGLIWAYNNITPFRDAVNGAKDALLALVPVIVDGIGQALTWLSANWPVVISIILGPLGVLIAVLTGHGDQVKQVFMDIWNTVLAWLAQEIPKIPEQVGFALGWVLAKFYELNVLLIAWATAAIPALIGLINTELQALPGQIWQLLLTVNQKFTEWMRSLIMWVGSPSGGQAFGNAFNEEMKKLPGQMLDVGINIVKGLWSGIQSVKAWFDGVVTSFVMGILKGAISGLPGPARSEAAKALGIDPNSFAAGSPFIPQDMLAYLHRGEMVVPAYESGLIRNGSAALAPAMAGGDGGGGRTIINNFNAPIDPNAGRRIGREIAWEMK